MVADRGVVGFAALTIVDLLGLVELMMVLKMWVPGDVSRDQIRGLYRRYPSRRYDLVL